MLWELMFLVLEPAEGKPPHTTYEVVRSWSSDEFFRDEKDCWRKTTLVTVWPFERRDSEQTSPIIAVCKPFKGA